MRRYRKDTTWIISKSKQNVYSLAVTQPVPARPSGRERAEEDKKINLYRLTAFSTKNAFYCSHSKDKICVCCLGK
jgi:hypothetical protein